VEGRHCQY